MKNKGITIIEIALVLCILGMLFRITVPIFKKAICLNRLIQKGLNKEEIYSFIEKNQCGICNIETHPLFKFELGKKIKKETHFE